jgi:hypothetical protein
MTFDIVRQRRWSVAVARGGNVLSIIMNWLVRGLLGAAGVCVFFVALPMARSAWETQKADPAIYSLRMQRPLDIKKIKLGIAAFDRAVAIWPSADHLLGRSELMGGAALTADLDASESERLDWVRRAAADLEKGLASAPVRGIDWLRLAAMRQTLDGASRDVLPPLFLSLDYESLVPQTWPTRFRLILDAWPYLDDAQKQRLSDYMRAVWIASDMTKDRRIFAWAIRSPTDELIIRYFLRDEPGAQAELTELIKNVAKR